jgi:hypothetical protein
LEQGVRKLKEKLFEIVGDINLEILKNGDVIYDVPIKITIEDVKKKYFKVAKINDLKIEYSDDWGGH